MANKDRTAVESGLSDILGNVIQSDRRRSGRGDEQGISSPLPDTMTSPIVITEVSNNTLTPYDINTIKQTDNNTNEPSDGGGVVIAPVVSSRKRQAKQNVLSNSPLLEKRIEEAQTLADSSTTTVTLRIPSALNDWLDEYVHGSWPEKVKKQQLVTEALQLLFARRGRPKEEVLATALLAENEQ